MLERHAEQHYERPDRDPSLPDFLIIGTQKAGTTALMLNLARHPEVYMAGRHGKAGEMQFFNAYWKNGEHWYRQHFTHPERLQGEKTPDYFANHQAQQRMAALVPHAKLIVSLRNPVDRAYSAWNHFNKDANAESKGWKRLAFEEAVRGTEGIFRHLLRYGYYAEHLRHLLHLYPRDQIHIVIAERMRCDPDAVFHQLLDFLQVSPATTAFTNDYAQGYDEPMHPGIREQLCETFSAHNEELFQLLGFDIPEWRAVPESERSTTRPGCQL